MRLFECVTGACTVFLEFSCSRLLDTKGPWFCSKGIGVSSYLYTKDRRIVFFGRCADVFLRCGRCILLFVFAVRSPSSFRVPLEYLIQWASKLSFSAVCRTRASSIEP